MKRYATAVLVLLALTGATYSIVAQDTPPVVTSETVPDEVADGDELKSEPRYSGATVDRPSIAGKWLVVRSKSDTGFSGDNIKVGTLGHTEYLVVPVELNGVAFDRWLPASDVAYVDSFDSEEDAERMRQSAERRGTGRGRRGQSDVLQPEVEHAR